MKILRYGDGHEWPTFGHRGQPCDAVVALEKRYTLNAISVMVARMQHSGLWWVVPRYTPDDSRFEDVGPYESADVAVTILILTGELET